MTFESVMDNLPPEVSLPSPNKALNLDAPCWTEGLKEISCPFTKAN